MNLRVGIIGISEGNGHPYSWSAICNGYSKKQMVYSGYPVIEEYLSLQDWPQARIKNVEVTHIYTQSLEESKKISRASLIKNIAKHPKEMLGSIDALLLARDDAENHLEFAEPFLKAGLPIYIDKPIALNISALDVLYQFAQFEGQIFSCSALRYAEELQLSEEEKVNIGKISYIKAVTPKSWQKYAVHVVDPVLRIIGDDRKVFNYKKYNIGEDGIGLIANFSEGVTVNFCALGEKTKCPISICIYGENGYTQLDFKDSFSSFKNTLEHFFISVRKTDPNERNSDYKLHKTVVSILEAGLQ